MEISASMVKELRERTGAGIMDCKRVLKEAKGDLDNAMTLLREKGLTMAAKKAGRETAEGMIGSYIHFGGKIGVLVEVNCETDFVARNEAFQNFVRDVTMQIASTNPSYLNPDDIPKEILEKEREIYRTQGLNEGKPEKIVERIVEGKLKKFYSQICLMEQPFIKEEDISIKDLQNRLIGLLGENIMIRRFVRFQLGEPLKSSINPY